MYTYTRARGSGSHLAVRVNIDTNAGAHSLYDAPGARVLHAHADVSIDGHFVGRTVLAVKQRWIDEIRSTDAHSGSEYETLLTLHAAGVSHHTQNALDASLWGSRAAAHIIRTCGQFSSRDGATCTLLEYAPSGDLQRLLQSRAVAKRALPEDVVWHLLHCLLRAIAHVHACGYLHRDVKPSNVLIHCREGGVVEPLDDDSLRRCDFTLADFGVARRVAHAAAAAGGDALARSLYGTPLYMSPEALHGHAYGFATDVWSLGVLAYEAVALQHPLRVKGVRSVAEAHDAAREVFPPLPVSFSHDLRALIAACLHVDPMKRPSAARALASIPVYRAAVPAPQPQSLTESGTCAAAEQEHTPAAESTAIAVEAAPISSSSSPVAVLSAPVVSTAHSGPRIVRVKHKRGAKQAHASMDGCVDTAPVAAVQVDDRTAHIVPAHDPDPGTTSTRVHVPLPVMHDLTTTPALALAASAASTDSLVATKPWNRAAANARRTHRQLRSTITVLCDVLHVCTADVHRAHELKQAQAAVVDAEAYIASVTDDTIPSDVADALLF